MAQELFRNWKNDLLSFQHNKMNLGLHSAGRYYGYDTLVRTGVLTFRLDHTAGNLKYKTESLSTIGPLGVVLTPQGVILHETAPITGLVVDSNAGNGKTRVDMVVLNHAYLPITGAAAGTYTIIKGPINNPVPGSLTDAYQQTIIGYLRIGAGEVDILKALWTKAQCPDSGDGKDARIFEPNVFKALQQWKKSATNLAGNLVVNRPVTKYTFNGTQGVLWTLPTDGNVFDLIPTAFPDLPGVDNIVDGFRFKDIELQEGAEIKIFASAGFLFRDSLAGGVVSGTSLYNDGFRAISISSGLRTGNSGLDNGVRMDAGETGLFKFIFWRDRWQLVGVENYELFTPVLKAALSTSILALADRLSYLDTFTQDNQPIADSGIVNFDLIRNRVASFLSYPSNLTDIYFRIDFRNARAGATLTVLFGAPADVPFHFIMINHGVKRVLLVTPQSSLTSSASGIFTYMMTATYRGENPNSDLVLTVNIEVANITPFN